MNDRIRFAVRCLSAALVMSAVWAPVARGDDAPPPPPQPTILEALFVPARQAISKLPPFLGDTDLKVHFRSYYFNRTNPDDTVNEAYALGGWIAYQSGWLFDTFAMGATLYGSAPIYTPPDRDGTLLLQPGQNGYYVPGEAWGALRYKEYALLKGYRQQVDQGYINPQDNRMTPNTFQGITLAGKVSWLQYLAGFLWQIKPRNSDEFISMSSQAGAVNSNDGVGLFGVSVTPLEGLRIDVSNQYGVNTFNTIYAEGQYLMPLNEDWKLRFGAQITDQRAVGDALLAPGNGRFWVTQVGGTRLEVLYRQLTLTAAFSLTGSGNNIQTPWGSYPGYLSMIELSFNRARETAALVGAAYDFSQVLTPGLSANVNLVWGWNAIDPTTRKNAPNQAEYDATVDYRPPFKVPVLQGMWVRFRSAIIDQHDAQTLGYQFRIIINWDRDLI